RLHSSVHYRPPALHNHNAHRWRRRRELPKNGVVPKQSGACSGGARLLRFVFPVKSSRQIFSRVGRGNPSIRI
ncbi:unnamed protein product, partial [Ectocarpus sp. 12 AP-2014]